MYCIWQLEHFLDQLEISFSPCNATSVPCQEALDIAAKSVQLLSDLTNSSGLALIACIRWQIVLFHVIPR